MPLIRLLRDHPSYTLMRGVARFRSIRESVTLLKRLVDAGRTRSHEELLRANMPSTLWPDFNQAEFIDNIRKNGCSFGLQLPPGIIDAIRTYADSHPVYAFRNEKSGFFPAQRAQAERTLGKEILLAQYYNVARDCEAARQLSTDPLLHLIALKYLGSVPRFMGCNLWWTYPITPDRQDQLKHAHYFHRDIDDFKFLKFFFYLTDVEPGDGGHWLVSGSHRKAPHIRSKDYFLTRRFEDAEIASYYPRSSLLEIVGPRGLGFAEDTLCVHKAASPSRHPRLLLHLQFALFDFGVGSDERRPDQLQMLESSAIPPGRSFGSPTLT